MIKHVVVCDGCGRGCGDDHRWNSDFYRVELKPAEVSIGLHKFTLPKDNEIKDFCSAKCLFKFIGSTMDAMVKEMSTRAEWVTDRNPTSLDRKEIENDSTWDTGSSENKE